jgi:hypothetical protein
MKCFDLNRDLTEPPECELTLVRADTMFTRLLGLLGKRAMASGQALWLKPCFAIHTVGMRFSLGVFFIDNQGVVVKTIARLQPNRFVMCWQATSVVETAAFANEQTDARSLVVMRAIAQSQWS